MGQGSVIVIVNGTAIRLTRRNQHSYQMNHWDFPQSIDPFSTVTVYVEFNENITVNPRDDGGDADYSLVDESASFHIHASFRNITVRTNANGTNYTDNLGWIHDGRMGFVLAGAAPNYFVHNSVSGESWMQKLLPSFGNRCLRDICLPASHDAGMSVVTNSTFFSIARNTQTQNLSIKGQLLHGSRMFDIRPVIGGGQYYTGHYSNIGGITNQGGRGQSIDSIITDINSFTASHQELVILKLSHDFNTDLGNNSYAPFTKAEYQALLQKLCVNGLNHLLPTTTSDPTLLPLQSLIAGTSCVIIFADTTSDYTLGYQGVYPMQGTAITVNNQGAMKTVAFDAQIPSAPPVTISDNYSNTNDVNSMSNGQLQKMQNFSFTGTATQDLFLLAWILSLSNLENVPPCTKAISDYADVAHQHVYEKILLNSVAAHHPNFLQLDYFDQHSFAALAVAINLKLTNTS